MSIREILSLVGAMSMKYALAKLIRTYTLKRKYIKLLILTTMATITVKQFVMLLTSQSIVSAASRMTPKTSSTNPYKCATPIMRIYCADGESLSIQAHGGCHVKFEDIKSQGDIYSLYSSTFGRKLAMCETDCEELDQYGIDDIEDIEKYVESHGGIDIEATTSHAIETAIKALEPYKERN